MPTARISLPRALIVLWQSCVMSSVVSSIPIESSYASPACRRAPISPPNRLISRPRTIGAVILCDVIAVTAAGAGSLFLPASHAQTDLIAPIAEIVWVAGVFFALLALRWGYTIRALQSSTRSIASAALALFLALSADVIGRALFAAYSNEKRAELLAWYFLALALCAITRVILASFIERWTQEGRLARRAVVVGGGDVAELLQKLERTSFGSIQILGLFDDREQGRSPKSVADHPRLGRFDGLVEFCRSQRVDLLVVALPLSAEERLLHLLKKLWVLPIDVRIAALGSRLKLRQRAYSYIGDVPFLPVFDKPMADWSVALKTIQV